MARKRVPAAEARAGMKDLVDAVKNRNERIKITRYGKTVAYLVPAKDGEALETCAEEIEACIQRAAAPEETARARGRGNGRPKGNGADRLAKTVRAEQSGVAPGKLVGKPAARSARPRKSPVK